MLWTPKAHNIWWLSNPQGVLVQLQNAGAVWDKGRIQEERASSVGPRRGKNITQVVVKPGAYSSTSAACP